MKVMRKLSVVCVLVAAWVPAAAEQPKIVGEKEIMKLKESGVYVRSGGGRALRLSPDGRHLLFLRRDSARGKPTTATSRRRRAYRMILRDLKTGKDKPVPIPAFSTRGFATAYLDMKIFDASGRRMVVPVSEDTNKNGLSEPREGEKMQLGIYDLAAGKIRKIDVKDQYVFPTFDGSGTKIIVLAMGRGERKGRLYVTPADKISLRKLARWGLPRTPCPTADLLPMLLPPDRGAASRPSAGKFVLYDLEADAVKARIDMDEGGSSPDDHNPQWTADGRYLYCAARSRETDADGRRRDKVFTRIWDAQKAREAAIVDGVTPVAPGPGGTMVMARWRSYASSTRPARTVAPGRDADRNILLHDLAAGRLWSLGDAAARPLDARGKLLVFSRRTGDGDATVYLAEIVLPAGRKAP